MLVYYLIIINVNTLVLMGYDKYCAIKNKSRISESTLQTCSFVGGFIGLASGMIIFNHKIRKNKFYIIIGLSIIIWTSIIYYLR